MVHGVTGFGSDAAVVLAWSSSGVLGGPIIKTCQVPDHSFIIQKHSGTATDCKHELHKDVWRRANFQGQDR